MICHFMLSIDIKIEWVANVLLKITNRQLQAYQEVQANQLCLLIKT